MVINEVKLYTVGDAKKVSTWSNIPYFLAKSLENRNIRVNYVNISPPLYLSILYDCIVTRFIRLFYKNTQYNFFRSFLYDWYVRFKIYDSDKKYTSTKFSIFLTYNSPVRSNKGISVLLSDWSFQYYLEKRLNKQVDFFEQRAIKRENQNISKASLVVSLFPLCASYISDNNPIANIKHLATNVVNDFNESKLSKDSLLKLKINRRSLLFIGRSHYLSGALLLIKEFVKIRNRKPDLILNIIGLNREDIKDEGEFEGIFFHGFLRKEILDECNLYYKLISEASIIINPTQKWGGYSSIIEAMYYYTPVITTPYDEFVEEFGNTINFGVYYNCKEQLSKFILRILEQSDENYLKMCVNSHLQVRDHTWQNYTDRLLKEINSCEL